MNESIIRNWNIVVQPGDHIYHLGDLSFGKPDETKNILRRLNGTKYWLLGNHDKDPNSVKEFFHWIKDYHEMDIRDEDGAKQKLILCHYPFVTWNKGHHGSWHLHGHCHGNLNHLDEKTTRYDVGVDCTSYTPISFEEIRTIMKKRKYSPVDHHGYKEEDED